VRESVSLGASALTVRPCVRAGAGEIACVRACVRERTHAQALSRASACASACGARECVRACVRACVFVRAFIHISTSWRACVRSRECVRVARQLPESEYSPSPGSLSET
jgi:hypothetical protein